MITNNVILRTFHIKFGNGQGTAFAIDREGKQYLVTARHVVEGISSEGIIEVFHDKQWKTLPVRKVGFGAGKIDVAVLTCQIQLTPPLRQYPLEASAEGLSLGQTVYFLGFPYGMGGGLEDINRNFPVPFMKAGICSTAYSDESPVMFIDAHNNPGFSGGPVVFEPMPPAQNKFRVAGVISGYRQSLEPVVDESGRPIGDAHGEPFGYVQENSGIVLVYSINCATDLIDANPIGFELPAG